MQKGSAIQLRSALSAAAVYAVLAAATASGAHRAGPNAIAMEPAPILVKAISTIRRPSVENSRASYEHVVIALDEARLRSAHDMHEGER